MNIQIAIRLDEKDLDLLDDLVERGIVTSRVAAIRRLIEKERRQRLVQADALIYAKTEPDEDMNALARWASTQPLDDLD